MYNKNRFLALIILSLVAGIQAADVPDGNHRSNRYSGSRFSNPQNRHNVITAIFKYVLETRANDGDADLRNNPWRLPVKQLLAIYENAEDQFCSSVEHLVAMHGIDPEVTLILDTKNHQGNNPLHIVAQYGTLEQALAAARVMSSTDFLHHENNHGQTPIEFARTLGKTEIYNAFQRTPLDSESDFDFGSGSESD